MRKGKFQEVKIVENEKGNNFKKLRLLKMRKGKFQEVKIVENEKGAISRS